MNYGDKVFVVQDAKQVLIGEIHSHTTHKGVVTGYSVSFPGEPKIIGITAFVKQSIFTDRKAADKELFKRKLKSDEEAATPATDKVGDRHWIAGHRRKW